MYFPIQAHQYRQYSGLLDQSFRLRKRIFADRLGWDVKVSGDMEKDDYDRLGPVYLIWCDDTQTRLYGSIRLMPTTGPTLLYDIFRDTFPGSCDLVAPSIWEGTRMCIDEELIAYDHPGLKGDQAFCKLLLALCEMALDNGIETLLSNYEPQMKRLYQRAGAEVEELGRSTRHGRYPVCCGLFEVSEQVLARMRIKLGVGKPLFTQKAPVPALSPKKPSLVSRSQSSFHHPATTALSISIDMSSPTR